MRRYAKMMAQKAREVDTQDKAKMAEQLSQMHRNSRPSATIEIHDVAGRAQGNAAGSQPSRSYRVREDTHPQSSPSQSGRADSLRGEGPGPGGGSAPGGGPTSRGRPGPEEGPRQGGAPSPQSPDRSPRRDRTGAGARNFYPPFNHPEDVPAPQRRLSSQLTQIAKLRLPTTPREELLALEGSQLSTPIPKFQKSHGVLMRLHVSKFRLCSLSRLRMQRVRRCRKIRQSAIIILELRQGLGPNGT